MCKKSSVFSNEEDDPASPIKVQKKCAALEQLCVLHLTTLLVLTVHFDVQTVCISWTHFLFSLFVRVIGGWKLVGNMTIQNLLHFCLAASRSL